MEPPPPLPPATTAATVDKDERSFGGIAILRVGRRSSDDLRVEEEQDKSELDRSEV